MSENKSKVELVSGGTISFLLFLLFMAGCNTCNRLDDIHKDLKAIANHKTVD